MLTETKNREGRILLIVLPLMVVMCLSLWYVRNVYRVDHMTRIELQNGSCDLTGFNFDDGFARLEGEVEYIPGILTPEEFAAREDEVQNGNPWDIPSATSRIRIKVPAGGVYTLNAGSIDYAHRAYVNGQLRFQAGIPAEAAAGVEPGHAEMTLDVTAENGVIEIIQQGANFVHREGGGHSNLYFGSPKAIRTFQALTFGPEYIIVGLFAALFFVHLVLFILRRSYRPNLTFSLLCFAWMIRSGFTGAKVFFAMFPSLPWQAAFRAEYLSLPIASILLVLLARQIFPGIPQKWFVRTVAAVSGAFSLLCLTADTVFLSWALMGFEGFFTLSIVYLCIWFIMKVPAMVRGSRFMTEQTVSLIAFIIFMYAAINDALHHLGIPYYLGFKSSFAMTGLAMLIFSFFQMTAMFYGTMRENALAHQREQKAESEKEMLAEMNRLKSEFYTDMSHEMKTPLTVIAVNAQFAAQNIGMGAVDDETVTDLNAISGEAMRLAQMVSSLVGIGRMQGADGLAPLDLNSLLTETVRIYQALFARRDNTLTAVIEPDLPPVSGSADQIIQVLINLLSNANRHTTGGAVSVQAETMETQIRISVIDNGEGITPDLLPHVFERFCHGEHGGSGLGLPICKSIIETHGGKMGINSKEGEGTTVWFTLPVKEDTI